jgi:hypothetical protein
MRHQPTFAIKLSIVTAVALGCQACSPPAKKPEPPSEALRFYREMAAASREIHGASQETVEMTSEVSRAVNDGRSFNKETVEQVYATRLEKLQALYANVSKMKPPPGAAAAALHVAMLRGVEGEERRYRIGIREWLNLYEDKSFTADVKKERGAAIRERLDAERAKDEGEIKAARQEFMSEFKISN